MSATPSTTGVGQTATATPVQAGMTATPGVRATRTPLPVLLPVGALGLALVICARRRNNR
jgi:hypothetical protein